MPLPSQPRFSRKEKTTSTKESISVEEIRRRIRRNILSDIPKDAVRVHHILDTFFPLKTKRKEEDIESGELAELIYTSMYAGKGVFFNVPLAVRLDIDGKKFTLVGHPDIIDPNERKIIEIKRAIISKRKKRVKKKAKTLSGEEVEILSRGKETEEALFIPQRYFERVKAQVMFYKWLLEKITGVKDWKTEVVWVDPETKKVFTQEVNVDTSRVEKLIKSYLRSSLFGFFG